MAEWEMQDEPEMMSLNDAMALMRTTAAAGGSAKIGPVLLDRLVKHVDGLQAERDEWKHIASAYSPQKELCKALEQSKASGRTARKERDELRARLTSERQAVRLTCDRCGTECTDPWHYSEGDRRHLHACDACGVPERQAVLLTDEQIEACRLLTGYAAGSERFRLIAIAIEAAALAANGLKGGAV